MRLNFFGAVLATVAHSLSLQSPAFNFAQLHAEKTPTCFTTSERAKLPLGKFYEVYNGDKMYEDPNF